MWETEVSSHCTLRVPNNFLEHANFEHKTLTKISIKVKNWKSWKHPDQTSFTQTPSLIEIRVNFTDRYGEIRLTIPDFKETTLRLQIIKLIDILPRFLELFWEWNVNYFDHLVGEKRDRMSIIWK